MSMRKVIIQWSCLLLFTLSAYGVPSRPEAVTPLGRGDQVPQVAVRDAAGERAALASIVADRPTVLVFYRGGWCPFCTRHLVALQEVQGRLAELGFQVVALSPDRPEKVAEAAAKNALNLRLFSDSEGHAMRGFGLAFVLPAETVSLYKEAYRIDVVGDSGQIHNQLPVPALYLITPGGEIQFAHFDSDYRERLDVEALLENARKIAQE